MVQQVFFKLWERNENLSLTGSVSAYLAGSAKNEELRISGSGKLLLEGVVSENAKTKISGSGDIKLTASQSLDVTISGSGSVYYHGHPLISTDISGSGRVLPL